MEKIKTKVRFTSLDVAAMVQNLQRLIGMRFTFIYSEQPTSMMLIHQHTLLNLENLKIKLYFLSKMVFDFIQSKIILKKKIFPQGSQ